MLRELGYCTGIENYSRYFDGRQPGDAPYTLLDYFPKDYIVFVDESHVTLPQIRAMYNGDRARKEALVSYGFRLPSAFDNRPAALRGIRAAHRPARLRQRHARALRAGARGAGRRADHPPDRPARSRNRGAPRRPGRWTTSTPRSSKPQARAIACWSRR